MKTLDSPNPWLQEYGSERPCELNLVIYIVSNQNIPPGTFTINLILIHFTSYPKDGQKFSYT